MGVPLDFRKAMGVAGIRRSSQISRWQDADSFVSQEERTQDERSQFFQ